jgi:hypothetical protein
VRLGPLLREHGFGAIRIEAIPILDTSYVSGNFSVGSAEWAARSAREQGVVTEAEAAAWLADLERLGAEGAYFFCVNRFLFSAVRL